MRRLSSISSLLSLRFVHRRSYNDNVRLQSVLRYYSSQIHQGPLAQYKSLVDEGKLRYDTKQEKVAVELEKLFTRLDQYEKDMEDYYAKLAEWEKSRENERRKILVEEAEQKQQGGILSSVDKQRSVLGRNWMRRRKAENAELGVGRWVSYLNREKKLDSVVGPCPIAPPAPKGLYIYGNVGSGKTMLMDMFYGATGSIVKHKRRLHFHEAMLNINERMHKICKNQEEKSLQSSIASWVMNLPFDMKVKEWLSGEEKYKQELQMKHILLTVADKFLVDEQTDKRGASILCFDEIQTVDVFATVALSGILSRLLTTGTVLVATSNRAPQELNQYGMQRETFQKLVSKFEEHCEIVPIGSEVDYRRYLAGAQKEQVKMQTRYFWPLESSVRQEYEEMWSHVTDQLGGQITSNVIPVMFGRTLEVPESCNGAARFTFEYLCGRPVGAADYIAIAENYHTVFLSEVPLMSMRIRDKARRFITLIDELYNHHCCLICSAAGPIDNLFQGTEDGTLFDLESFQFETEIEGVKLRRDVLAEGSISSRVTPAGIGSMMSGQEEMFAFRRAVSRLIEMQTPRYLEEVRALHPKYQS